MGIEHHRAEEQPGIVEPMVQREPLLQARFHGQRHRAQAIEVVADEEGSRDIYEEGAHVLHRRSNGAGESSWLGHHAMPGRFDRYSFATLNPAMRASLGRNCIMIRNRPWSRWDRSLTSYSSALICWTDPIVFGPISFRNCLNTSRWRSSGKSSKKP